jgi:DnaJ-class molecular chaperone
MIIIPLGLKDGEKVIISGCGNQHRRRGTFGDLVISINIVNDKE